MAASSYQWAPGQVCILVLKKLAVFSLMCGFFVGGGAYPELFFFGLWPYPPERNGQGAIQALGQGWNNSTVLLQTGSGSFGAFRGRFVCVLGWGGGGGGRGHGREHKCFLGGGGG